MSSNDKAAALLKHFQKDRRRARKKKLLKLFGELHDEFDSLVPVITANISNILSLSNICHHVDRAVGIIKRYKQLANEAQHYDIPCIRRQKALIGTTPMPGFEITFHKHYYPLIRIRNQPPKTRPECMCVDN